MTERFQRPPTADDGCDATESRLNALDMAIVDIVGSSGNNGKLGALKERVDKADARKWWAMTFMAGLLVTVIGASIKFGRWMSEIETDVRWLKERRRPSISLPVDAGKETTTP